LGKKSVIKSQLLGTRSQSPDLASPTGKKKEIGCLFPQKRGGEHSLYWGAHVKKKKKKQKSGGGRVP